MTQRFIECNKRNKYRGLCCEIKKFIYDARTILTFHKTYCESRLKNAKEFDMRIVEKESLIAFGSSREFIWHS